MSDEQRPFDEKTDAIATVLDEFPPGQVSAAIQKMVKNDDKGLTVEALVVAASNVASPEEIAEIANQKETGPYLQATHRPDAGLLGLCAMYECTDAAEETVRIQPEELGGLVIDVPACPSDANRIKTGEPEEMGR